MQLESLRLGRMRRICDWLPLVFYWVLMVSVHRHLHPVRVKEERMRPRIFEFFEWRRDNSKEVHWEDM